MAQSAAPAIASQAREGVRLRGIWLLLGRAAWIVAALVALAILIAGVPARVQSLDTVPPEAARIIQQLHPWEAVLWRESGLGVQFYAVSTTVLDLFSSLAWLVIAAVIFWRRSADRAALIIALALALFAVAMNGFPDALARQHPGWSLPLRGLVAAGALFLTGFFYVFPDGRFIPGWPRRLLLVAAPVYALLYVIPSRYLDPRLSLFGAFVLILLTGTGVGAQIYRYRRVTGPIERQQIKWAIGGMAALVAGLIVVIVTSGLAAVIARSNPSLYVGMYVGAYGAFTICKLLIPISLAIAILRYRLWDTDLILNRTLVYATLTANVVALYVLIVVGIGTLFRLQGNIALALLATALVAILFHPLHERLQRGVNRLLYGQRDEPYAVLSRLGRQLEGTLAPHAVLPSIVETVAQALKLPYVAIALRQDDTLVVDAAVGSPSGDPLRLPLLYHGETIGQLCVGLRSGEDAFSAAERRLLEDLARQAGVAAHAVRLTTDLQRARERLVTAREEERRRLRRDLHDGLGPGLASVTLMADAARNLLTQHPAAAAALLNDLKQEAQAATAEVRRVIYQLRPPSLDELGLVPALQEQAAQYRQTGLHVTVVAPAPLPPLPAAVEVAAYRIAQEAMINVVRHAQARDCTVRLELADGLRLEIADDGCGLNGARPGVGLTSMRERAEELGGRCVVVPLAGGGTIVRAILPLGAND